MALTYSEMIPLGKSAPKFKLKGIDDKFYSIEQFSGKKALVIMFLCRHCPYVVAVQQRLADLAKKFTSKNVQFVAICSNDSDQYPEDSVDNLRIQAKELGFEFPYLVDTTQEVAKSYGAVATPDIFVFDEKQILRYRGRIDDSWKDPAKVTRRDLHDAIQALIEDRSVNADQLPSMGCSIKWRF